MYDAILHILGGCRRGRRAARCWRGPVSMSQSAEQIGDMAAQPVRVPQGYILAMQCRRGHLLDALDSQAHDFSMRAQLPVQIGHTNKIGSLRQGRTC